MFEKILEAILGLTAALNAHTAALTGDAPKAAGKKAATKDTPNAGASAANTATVGAQAGTPTNVASTAGAAQATAGAVSSQDAANTFVRVCNEVNRETAVSILTKYGAQTFAGVKPEHWAAFKADCEATLKPAAPTGASGLL